jgi:hemoglobin
MFLAAAAILLLQEAPVEAVDWDKEFGVEERVRDPQTGEFPVAPYQQGNANAGADPFPVGKLSAAFGGQPGIKAIADRTVDLSEADPRISAIFVSHDTVRLRRTLFEQFCYLLAAGCDYSGRDMAAAHAGMGLKIADLNALVENLQQAMRERDVPFRAQNRLLSKLAPMSEHLLAH